METTAARVVAAKGPGVSSPIELRRRLVAESLSIGNPPNNARDLPAQSDPRLECHIEVEVDDIRAYEHNPRRVINSKFAEIKESIRSCGIRNPLTVTRRPGEKHFIVEAGGNTRLTAIQQLWAETREARFARLTVLFRPWRSESQVLTAHLIENEQRGEMTFWDKANGVSALKCQLEVDQGRTLSLRQLEGELKAIGLAVNTATLSQYLFAIERLRTLGEAVIELSGLDVKTIQPRLNALKRHAQQRTSIEEDRLYETVFEPIFRQQVDCYSQTREFTTTAFCNACEQALADHLGEPVAWLRKVLDSPLETPPQSSLASLRHPEQILPPDAPADRGKAALAATRGAEGQNNPPNQPTTLVARGGTLDRRNDKLADLRELLNLEVRRFAESAGIDECLRQDDQALLGYEIAALARRDDEQPDFSDFAWRLLGSIATSVESCSSISIDSAIDPRLIAWLIDGSDEAAGAFLRILTLIREIGLRASCPRPTVVPMKQGRAN